LTVSEDGGTVASERVGSPPHDSSQARDAFHHPFDGTPVLRLLDFSRHNDPDDTPDVAAVNDLELFARLAADDGQALGALMEVYWRPMVAFALGRVQSQDAAEDLVQETFVRLWEHRRQIRPEASPRSYLYRVLRNLITDTFRRRHLFERFSFFKSQQDPVDVPSPQAVLEVDELSRAAERAIAALPERRREVFVLAHLHNLSHREVAEALGITPRTVANHMTLALTQLRTALATFRGTTRGAGRSLAIKRRMNDLPADRFVPPPSLGDGTARQTNDAHAPDEVPPAPA